MADQLNARIYSHTSVDAVDPENATVTFGQQTIQFSQLVLACGASVVHPSLSGDAIGDVMSVNQLEHYDQFRQWLVNKKQIAILGTGLVGCEFANDLMNAGYQVTLIAPENHPLALLLPMSVARWLEQAMAEQGATWQWGHSATEINHANGQYAITLSNRQQFMVDGVFSAVGLRPNISLAKQAGLSVNQGIVVDRWLKTSASNIFALGDCAEVDGVVQMYVAPLLQCARALAKILVGGQDPVHYPAMPIVLKTPAFPLIFSAPPAHIIGEWHLEGEGHDLRALFHDELGQLYGFALAGNKVRDKMALAKKLPLVFSE